MKKIQAYLGSDCSNLGSGRTNIIPPLDAEVCSHIVVLFYVEAAFRIKERKTYSQMKREWILVTIVFKEHRISCSL